MALRLALTGLTLALMDVDRKQALLEGPFHRAPVQQLSLTSPTNDPAPCSILASCSALSRLYKDYATITWTVNGRLLENFINRSTLSTVKKDVSVNVSKIAINHLEQLASAHGKFVTKATFALGSIFEDTCTSNAQCEPDQASCNEDRYLYKPSEPVSLKSKDLTCRAAAGLGYHCDCALEFVRSLDGKTCDKLQTTAGNISDNPARPTANDTQPEPLASRTSAHAPATRRS
ncbi:hypothetical protein HPB49_013227 [Dermacentor silvarum]|uniref:Uncharacterized protein n=1 Tax=Dermacentor silvarum TaxID=543639 RepID=A0ACB8CL87_DERSI|nr:hypothetical protein HPB49_013227 [Dermacentor silvarum]